MENDRRTVNRPVTPRGVSQTPLKNQLASARKAREDNTAKKIARARAEQEVWKRDLEERKGLKAAEMRKEAERRRNMSALTARRKVLAEKRAATEAATKEKERLVLEEANSDWREVRDKQEAAKKARRRQSIMLNNSILERFKERAEALAQQEASQRQEDAQLKALDLAAVAEATARAATARRQSVMGRGLVQKMHKQQQDEERAQKLADQVGVFNIRHAHWQQEQENAQAAKRAARESLAHRLQAHKESKEAEKAMTAKHKDEQQDELRSRKNDWMDVQMSAEKQKKTERASLSARLEQWRCQKEAAVCETDQQKEAARFELELRAQEAADVAKYKATMRSNRRESMADRLVKAKADSDWERGQVQLLALALEQEREVQEQERADVEALADVERARQRESLAARGEAAKQSRFLDEASRQAQAADEADEWALCAANRADVEAVEDEARARDRMSLAAHLAAKKVEKEVAIQAHYTNLASLHESFMLRGADAADVAAYKANQQQRRRQSVAVRLDSWRQQRVLEAVQEQRAAVEAQEERRMKDLELLDLEEARQALKDEELLDRLLGNMMF